MAIEHDRCIVRATTTQLTNYIQVLTQQLIISREGGNMSKPILAFLAITVLVVFGLGLFLPEKEVNRIGQQYESEGQQHLQTLDQKHPAYKTDPPTSGPHYVQPAAWGTSEVEIADEQLLHNLEHGGVVISYRPDLSEEQIDELRRIAANLTMRDEQTSKKGFKVILVPRAKNTSAVQLSSWRYNLKLGTVDQSKIQQFYRDRPNIAPEPNAT